MKRRGKLSWSESVSWHDPSTSLATPTSLAAMEPTLYEAFLNAVRTRTDDLAIVTSQSGQWDDSVQQTWGELAKSVASVASALLAILNDRPSDQKRVLYLHRNRLSDVLVSLACMAIGATEVPIDERRGPSHLDFVRHSVDGVWIDSEFVGQALKNVERNASVMCLLESLGKTENPGNPALILWTTGTLAKPKGVVLSHYNLLFNAQAKLQAVPQSADDVRLTTLPLSHAYARTCDFGTWLLSGSTLVLSLGYQGWQTLATRYPPTIANVVPSLAYRLLSCEHESARSKLRLLGVGGAPLSHEAFHQYRELGVTVIQGYGLTETSPVICSASPTDAAAGLVGRPVAGCEIELRNGRLFVRGPNVMLGYWNDDDATRERIDDQGWLDTGDLAELDESTGQYRIIGRADDLLILANGNKVHPREIESLVEELPEVTHAMLLLHRDELQLWFDAISETDESAIAKQIETRLLAVPVWMRPMRVMRFNPTLSANHGELTFKGGVRRRTIMKRRFAH